jgi:signal transduction histidine kinase
MILGLCPLRGWSDDSARRSKFNIESGFELGKLASTLNDMMECLKEAFSRQRQFASAASHELRTPLTVIQAESKLALEKVRSANEYKKSLETIS